MRKTLKIALVLFLGTAITGAGGLYWLAKRAEPNYDGAVTLPGLVAPVQVGYGPHAVPSIDARSLDDLLFAQGYVVAAERMWQMDLMRRLAGGRLAEAFGEAALPTDRFFHTIGLPRAARQGLDALEPAYQRLLQRYADGVNAYRALAAGRLPLEYLIAGFEPAPWRPEDSLAIGEYMAWINSVNLREELVFLRLAQRLGNRRALELFPEDEGLPAPADADDLPDYQASEARAAGAILSTLQQTGRVIAGLGLPGVGAASNAWAVTGTRTLDGQALLANDPHLGPSTPAIWYELELRAPGYHATGVALPGVPLILIGHNADLAWGLTTAMADTQDLFIERPSDDGTSVLRPDGTTGPIRFETREIRVKGRDEPVRHVVRSTRHGVLINDLVGHDGANPFGLTPIQTRDLLALRTNLEVPERAFAGLYRLNTARTVDQARAAIRELRHVSQNLIVAHRDGGIGWQVSGLLPRRGRGSGSFPAPGWESGYGWDAYRPASENPGLSDPPAQRLISANDRALAASQGAELGHGWLAPYRAQRIAELLDVPSPIDAEAMARMQQDRQSTMVRIYLGSLRRALPRLRQIDPGAAEIAERDLLRWNGDFAGDSHPAALFALLQPALYHALYGDELGPDLGALMGLAVATYGPLEEALRTDRSSFWDDVGTADIHEGPAEVWARALQRARSHLDELLPDEDDQRLDRLHRLRFPHAFNRQPLLGDLFGIGPVGIGGDSSTINVANTGPDAPREVGYVPSMRVVYTPADWTRTRGTLPLGQSGHRLSHYRRDQLTDWMLGRTHPWPWNGPVAGQQIGQLRLLPPRDRAAAPGNGRGD